MILKVLYWLAVLAISLALVFALVLFFESRDDSGVDGAGGSVIARSCEAPAARTART